jgi:hypothetical protein
MMHCVHAIRDKRQINTELIAISAPHRSIQRELRLYDSLLLCVQVTKNISTCFNVPHEHFLSKLVPSRNLRCGVDAVISGLVKKNHISRYRVWITQIKVSYRGQVMRKGAQAIDDFTSGRGIICSYHVKGRHKQGESLLIEFTLVVVFLDH